MADKTTPKNHYSPLCLYLAEPISIFSLPPKGKREEGRGTREEGRGKREQGSPLCVGRDTTTTSSRILTRRRSKQKHRIPDESFPLKACPFFDTSLKYLPLNNNKTTHEKAKGTNRHD
jgi:hypothetical protein